METSRLMNAVLTLQVHLKERRNDRFFSGFDPLLQYKRKHQFTCVPMQRGERKYSNYLLDLVSSDTIKHCTRVVYDKQDVFSAPTGDVALTHLSRVRAAVVTVAILFWKSNWTGGTATLPFRQVCCENPEGMKIWITFLGARWDSEYIFWGLALDWIIFRHAACNINRKNGLIATIAG